MPAPHVIMSKLILLVCLFDEVIEVTVVEIVVLLVVIEITTVVIAMVIVRRSYANYVVDLDTLFRSATIVLMVTMLALQQTQTLLQSMDLRHHKSMSLKKKSL